MRLRVIYWYEKHQVISQLVEIFKPMFLFFAHYTQTYTVSDHKPITALEDCHEHVHHALSCGSKSSGSLKTTA